MVSKKIIAISLACLVVLAVSFPGAGEAAYRRGGGYSATGSDCGYTGCGATDTGSGSGYVLSKRVTRRNYSYNNVATTASNGSGATTIIGDHNTSNTVVGSYNTTNNNFFNQTGSTNTGSAGISSFLSNPACSAAFHTPAWAFHTPQWEVFVPASQLGNLRVVRTASAAEALNPPAWAFSTPEWEVFVPWHATPEIIALPGC